MFQETHFQVSKELIEALDERFPMRDFDTSSTLRELDYHYGQRSVINFLRDKLEEQIENSLTSIFD
jgi:hypothetical protein